MFRGTSMFMNQDFGQEVFTYMFLKLVLLDAHCLDFKSLGCPRRMFVEYPQTK